MKNKNRENSIWDLLSEILKDQDAIKLEEYKKLFEKTNNNEVDYNIKYKIYNISLNYLKENAKKQNTYLIIDNIQNVSKDVLDFINYIIFNGEDKKIFIVMTSIEIEFIRDKVIQNQISSWANDKMIIDKNLGNLNLNETRKLLIAMLGTEKFQKQLLDYLYLESNGSFKYIEYLIRELYNREEIYIDKKGEWSSLSTNLNNIYIPLQENNIIKNQIENMEKSNLEVLKVLSIFENEVKKHNLQLLIGNKDMPLETIIGNLKTQRIIKGKEYLSIVNGEIKKHVYWQMDKLEREMYHDLTLKILLKHYKSDNKIEINEIIHHYIKNNKKKEALDFLIKETTLDIYAEELWEKAYSIGENLNEENILIVLKQLIEINLLKGNMDRFKKYKNELIKKSQEMNRLDYYIKCIYYEGEMEISKNNLKKAKEIIDQLKILYKDYYYLEIEIQINILEAKYQIKWGYIENLNVDLIRISKLIEEKKLINYKGIIINLLGIYNYLSGNIKDAIEYYEESINILKDNSNTLEYIKPLNNIGEIYLEIYGNYNKSLKYFNLGYEISSKYDILPSMVSFSKNIVKVYTEQGNIKEALNIIGSLQKLIIDLEDKKTLFETYVTMGIVYIKSGDYGKAIEIKKTIDAMIKLEVLEEQDTNSQYFYFLGKFYGNFGIWDESLKAFEKNYKLTEQYNRRQFLNGYSNYLIIKYNKSGEFNKAKIKNILKEYEKIPPSSEIMKQILNFANISIMEEDIGFGKEIMDLYEKMEFKVEDSEMAAFKVAVKLKLSDNIDQLKKYESIDIWKYTDETKLYFYRVLATEFYKNNDYKRAARYLLLALDIIFKIQSKVNDLYYKEKIIIVRYGDQVKELLKSSLEILYKKTVNYISANEIKDKNYADFKNIFKVLTLEEFVHIFLDEKLEIENLDDLIYSIDGNHYENINKVLKYICKISLSTRGYILKKKDGEEKYEILSIYENAKGKRRKLNETLIYHSDKNDSGIILNRNFKNIEDSKYIEFLEEELVGKIIIPVVSQDRKQEVEKRRKDLLKNNSKVYLYLETESYLNIYDFSLFENINKLKKLIYLNVESIMLKDMTITDKLTGVYTRKFFDLHFENIIEKYEEYKGGFSLLMVDIDNFKEINDTYGHLVGDEILAQLGKTLIKNTRSTDVVGRYGGEEFIIILFDTSQNDAREISDKLRREVNKINIPNTESSISISIGIAQYPDHSIMKKELISKADQALYNAKSISGKNSIVFWKKNMKQNINSMDKLAGIFTGNSNRDNVNLNRMVEMVSMINSKTKIEDKIYSFLDGILEVLNADSSYLIRIDESIYSRSKYMSDWTKVNDINYNIINRVLDRKEGEYLIDWENSNGNYKDLGVPRWQSKMVIPLIKNDKIIGVVYIIVALKKKEFTFEDYNLGKLLTNIFVGNFD